MAMKAMKAAKAAAPPKPTKAAAKAAAKAAQKEREAAQASTIVCRRPDDAVWWFADTRRVKSVWSVAWLYNGKIQQAMYKED